MKAVQTKKKSATQMQEIERLYGKDFGLKDDKKIAQYIKKLGYPGLSRLLGYE